MTRKRKPKAAKKRQPAKKKAARRRKLRAQTPITTESTAPAGGSIPLDPVSSSTSAGQDGALGASSGDSVVPEVGTLHPPSHGRGLIRYGNPGNSGGGRLPLTTRREIGRMVREHGLPFLERVLARQEVDLVPIKVKGPSTIGFDEKGKAMRLEGGERVELVDVPVNVRTVVGALAVALSSSEGMVAPEKPGQEKRRILEVRLVSE